MNKLDTINKLDIMNKNFFDKLTFSRKNLVNDLEDFYFKEFAPLIKEYKSQEHAVQIWNNIQDLCPDKEQFNIKEVISTFVLIFLLLFGFYAIMDDDKKLNKILGEEDGTD